MPISAELGLIRTNEVTTMAKISKAFQERKTNKELYYIDRFESENSNLHYKSNNLWLSGMEESTAELLREMPEAIAQKPWLRLN